MRVLLTGSSGFVGRWLRADLLEAGHEVIDDRAPGGHVDVTDPRAIEALVAGARPDAIAHLAGVSFGPDARKDPARAFLVNVGGTATVIEAARRAGRVPALLVTGSSEVYGVPAAGDLPLGEHAALRTRQPYGLSKLGQESLGVAAAMRHGLRVVVTRSFNHIGPGQRPEFAIPAFLERALTVRAGAAAAIRAGNVDVRRDFTDVRDVVAAYRMLLEAAVDGRVLPGADLNVCSGRTVALRDVIVEMCEALGIEPNIELDDELLRADDPPEIVGDPSALCSATGWAPRIPLRDTIRDMIAAAPIRS